MMKRIPSNGDTRTDLVSRLRSALPEIVWPAVPSAEGATALAVQFQLERSQWLAPERLRELQFRQVEILVRHAYATVPYYRERWHGSYDPDAPLTPNRLARLPLLARHDLQAAYDVLKSENVPPAHGLLAESRTSGSTGTPVRVLKTALNELWWRAFTLRDHRWHGRDLSGKLAAIRHKAVMAEADGWGAATDGVLVTGPSATLPVSVDVDSQLEWLLAQKPDYLLTYPSNVAELAKRSLTRGVRLTGLREVRTIGEALGPEVRELCRQAWGAPLTDTYSADEVGYIALQCPGCEHYHVQSEGVLVEVLDPEGQPCEPGTTGRVVVTALHSFAMPLVRYELGDFAEVGAPCACGRGLPLLARIVGRIRNMLVLADGRRYWPHFGSRGLNEIAPVLQHQFVQKSHELIEARLVTAVPLRPEQEDGLRRHLLSRLPARFQIRFVYLPEIPRSASGKFEDFVCEIA